MEENVYVLHSSAVCAVRFHRIFISPFSQNRKQKRETENVKKIAGNKIFLFNNSITLQLLNFFMNLYDKKITYK